MKARWHIGRKEKPESGSYDIMNIEVRRCEVANDRLIVIAYENARAGLTAAFGVWVSRGVAI